MKFKVLATDYDGTIARHGTVEESTRQALQQLKESGRKLMLITGRELPDLYRAFPSANIFDRIVAENGGLVYSPSTGEIKVLSSPPPETFIDALRTRGVNPLSIGRVVVATQENYKEVVLQCIQEFGLKLQVVLNKGAVMILPGAVDKATGLLEALKEFDLAPVDVLGVGDAENDETFLRLCGYSAAVGNALPGLKRQVDFVTTATHGAGVEELIHHLLTNDLANLPPKSVQEKLPLKE